MNGQPATFGSVQFFDGSALLGTVQMSNLAGIGGSAIFETRLAAGSHSLTAVYSGAPLSTQYNNGSTSAPLIITITGRPTTATSLSVSSPAPGTYNLTATVSTFDQTAAAGSVAFNDVSGRISLGKLPISRTGSWGLSAPILTPLPQFADEPSLGWDLNGDGVARSCDWKCLS